MIAPIRAGFVDLYAIYILDIIMSNEYIYINRVHENIKYKTLFPTIL